MALALNPKVNGTALGLVVFVDEEEGRSEQAFLNLIGSMNGDTVEWDEQYVPDADAVQYAVENGGIIAD